MGDLRRRRQGRQALVLHALAGARAASSVVQGASASPRLIGTVRRKRDERRKRREWSGDRRRTNLFFKGTLLELTLTLVLDTLGFKALEEEGKKDRRRQLPHGPLKSVILATHSADIRGRRSRSASGLRAHTPSAPAPSIPSPPPEEQGSAQGYSPPGPKNLSAVRSELCRHRSQLRWRPCPRRRWQRQERGRGGPQETMPSPEGRRAHRLPTSRRTCERVP